MVGLRVFNFVLFFLFLGVVSVGRGNLSQTNDKARARVCVGGVYGRGDVGCVLNLTPTLTVNLNPNPNPTQP